MKFPRELVRSPEIASQALVVAKYEIWDVSGTAGSGNTITLLPYASESIFGVPVNPIASNYGHLSIVSDGLNWFLSP